MPILGLRERGACFAPNNYFDGSKLRIFRRVILYHGSILLRNGRKGGDQGAKANTDVKQTREVAHKCSKEVGKIFVLVVG